MGLEQPTIKYSIDYVVVIYNRHDARIDGGDNTTRTRDFCRLILRTTTLLANCKNIAGYQMKHQEIYVLDAVLGVVGRPMWQSCQSYWRPKSFRKAGFCFIFKRFFKKTLFKMKTTFAILFVSI